MTDMPDHDGLLARRFAALATPDAGDWLDVRRRARRTRMRRGALLLAAAIAAILVAAPALGLHRVIVDWVDAALAPQDVQVEFMQLVEGVPPRMDPKVIPDSARKVTSVEHEGKEHVLWVAPTRRGGFCFLWTGAFGGCMADRALPRVPASQDEVDPLLLGLSWGRNGNSSGVPTLVGGQLLAPETERLTLEYADGSETDIAVVWVSAPIDAGFYLYWIPAEHREEGRHLTAVIARDHDGDVLARKTFQLRPR